jgi:hypothetical protein
MQTAEESGDLGGQLLSGFAFGRDGLGQAASNIAVGEAAHVVLAPQQGLEADALRGPGD